MEHSHRHVTDVRQRINWVPEPIFRTSTQPSCLKELIRQSICGSVNDRQSKYHRNNIIIVSVSEHVPSIRFHIDCTFN